MTYRIKARYVDMPHAQVFVTQYADGSTALQAMDMDYPFPETLSINLSAYGMYPGEGHVFVKDYSEHEGLPDALHKAAVAMKVARVTFGQFDSPAWIMRLLTLGEEGEESGD